MERIEKLLEDVRDLSPERYAVCMRLRELALAAGPGVTEEVKYGGILFSARVAFCGVFAYMQHVSLEFGEGAQLSDPHHVLEGGGKHRRHIKLRSLAEIEDKHVRDYINAAYARVQPG